MTTSTGSGYGNDGGTTTAGTPPATTLNCDGFPQSIQLTINGTTQTFTKVCLILQETAAVTPAISVTANTGNVTTHGGPAPDAFTVYARIVAQAADEGTATALAKSVVVTTAGGNISATPDHVDFPQTLEVDYEAFTATTTNLTLSSNAGNTAADNYNATLKLTNQLGNVALQNVQGQVNVDDAAGNIDVKVTGAAWSGAGLTATTKLGNITLGHPAGYQASFSAESDLGIATIDGKSATTLVAGTPAIVTSGSGSPITLKTVAGNVTVSVTQ